MTRVFINFRCYVESEAEDDDGSGSESDNDDIVLGNEQVFKMDPGTKQTVLDTPLCLEEGKRYQIKLISDQYDPAAPNPKAAILIDAVSPHI